MQPPNLLATRLEIQELYPLPVIFPLISPARGNFPCTLGFEGWKPEAVGYPKRVRNRLPCQPTGLPTGWFANRPVDRNVSAPQAHTALPAPDIPVPYRKCPGGCLGGRASPLSNPLTGPYPRPLRGRVCETAREGERPRSPIPPQGLCPLLYKREMAAEGRKPHAAHPCAAA